MLSRYSDVVAALAHEGIVSPGGGGPVARASSGVREAGAREDMTGLPLRGLVVGQAQPIDLLEQVAAPWGFELAMAMTQAPRGEADRLKEWSRQIFCGAADARVFGVSPRAVEATSALAVVLGGPQAPWRAQAFVALAETLPRLLAGAWFVLARNPEMVQVWKDRPESRTRAMNELIRVASPSRLVFRTAAIPVEIGGVTISEGDSVQLALGAANHDPVAFSSPHLPRPDRGGPPPLSFGRGSHACPGAALIRRLAAHATATLLDAVDELSLAGPVTWTGHAIRGPSSVQVRLVRSR